MPLLILILKEKTLIKPQAERIAALEVEVAALQKSISSMDTKLDELLALRNKGAGAFWALTLISGTGLATAITWVLSIFKG